MNTVDEQIASLIQLAHNTAKENLNQRMTEMVYNILLGLENPSYSRLENLELLSRRKEVASREKEFIEKINVAPLSECQKNFLMQQAKKASFAILGLTIIYNQEAQISLFSFNCLSPKEKVEFQILLGMWHNNELTEEKILEAPEKKVQLGKLNELARLAVENENTYYKAGRESLEKGHNFTSEKCNLLSLEKQEFITICLGKLAKNISLSAGENSAMLSFIEEAHQLLEVLIRQKTELNLYSQFGRNFIEYNQSIVTPGLLVCLPEADQALLTRHIGKSLLTVLSEEENIIMANLIAAARIIENIKNRLLAKITDSPFAFPGEEEWFLTYPGKEKEHFELIIRSMSNPAINTIESHHIENYLHSTLSDEEFAKRFEIILAASSTALGKVVDNPSYLNRYLTESNPNYLTRIKKFLFACSTDSIIRALKETHWKRLKLEDYCTIPRRIITKIPPETIEFLSTEIIEYLYSVLSSYTMGKQVAEKDNLILLIQAVERKRGIRAEQSISISASSMPTPFPLAIRLSFPLPASSLPFIFLSAPSPSFSPSQSFSPLPYDPASFSTPASPVFYDRPLPTQEYGSPSNKRRKI